MEEMGAARSASVVFSKRIIGRHGEISTHHWRDHQLARKLGRGRRLGLFSS